MNIKCFDRNLGYATIEIRDTELMTLNNILFYANKSGLIKDEDQDVIANLYLLNSLMHNGFLPDFEREQYNKKMQKFEDWRNDNEPRKYSTKA
jgi:hypothetical protein